MRLWKILLVLLLVLTGSGPSALASIPLAPQNPCTGHFRGVVSGSRYYNPTTGRWIGRDSVGEIGGGNLFAFVQNAPIMRIDALGHIGLPGQAAAGAIATGLATFGAANFDMAVEQAVNVVEVGEAEGAALEVSIETDSTELYEELTEKIAGTEGHHTIPKFLGGNPAQFLYRLPGDIHDAFHSNLAAALRGAGFNMPIGGSAGSTDIWLKALRDPQSQLAAFNAVFEASMTTDAQYGTSITETTFLNFLCDLY